MLEEDGHAHETFKSQRKHKAKGPLEKKNYVKKKIQLFCTHCHKQGHLVEKCWTLYPANHPRHLNKVEGDLDKNGKEDSIIDVGHDDLHDDVKLKEAPLKWCGKRWLDLLSN